MRYANLVLLLAAFFSLVSPCKAESSLANAVTLFTSPIGLAAFRANFGIRAPIASQVLDLPITLSVGAKGTYFSSAYQVDPSIGCESCGQYSWRTRGYEAGPLLYLSVDFPGKPRWLDSFDLRLGSYLTQVSGLPDSALEAIPARDSLHGLALEAMTFANLRIAGGLFTSVGSGIIAEPHRLSGNGIQELEYELEPCLEFDLGITL